MIKLGFSPLILIVVGVLLAITIVGGSFAFRRLRAAGVDVLKLVKNVFKWYFCAPVGKILGWFIAPRKKSKGLIGLKLYTWIAVQVTLFAALLIIQPSVTTLYTAIFLTALNLTVIAIALFVIKEETEIWDGLLLRHEAAFGSVTFIKNTNILFVSTFFSLLYIALLVMLWDEVITNYPIVSVAPHVDCPKIDCRYVSFALAVGHQLPGVGYLIRKFEPSEVVFSPWLGSFVAWAIYTVTWLWVFGVYAVLWRQRREVKDLLVALDKARDTKNETDIEFLLRRVLLAPLLIQDELLSMAVDDTNEVMQRRAISIMPEAKILTFPQTFLEHVHEQENMKNKLRGLETIEVFLETPEYKSDLELVSDGLQALVYQIERNKIGRNKRRLGSVALAKMEALLMTYADLALQVGPSILDRETVRKRIIDIAIRGEGGVQGKAFKFSAERYSFALCNRVVNDIGRLGLADLELVEKCSVVAKERRAEWSDSDRAELVKLIEGITNPRRRRHGRARQLTTVIKQKLEELKRLIISVPAKLSASNDIRRAA